MRPPYGVLTALERLSEIALVRDGVHPKGPVVLVESAWNGETLSWLCNVDGYAKTFAMVEPIDMLIRALEMVGDR